MTREWMKKQTEIYNAIEVLKENKFLKEKDIAEIQCCMLHDIIGHFASELVWGDQKERNCEEYKIESED